MNKCHFTNYIKTDFVIGRFFESTSFGHQCLKLESNTLQFITCNLFDKRMLSLCFESLYCVQFV